MNEIERKFLVNGLPSIKEIKAPALNVEQGYLSIQPYYEVRISNRLKLTRKIGEGLSRQEDQIDISKEIFDMLWPLTEGKRIYKNRFFYDAGNGRTLEIDVYNGKNWPLIVAEIEFGSIEEALAYKPAYFLGKEITYDSSFKNASLAK